MTAHAGTMGAIENRKTERFETVLAIRIDRGGVVVEGTTVNLSLGGTLVRARLEPKPKIGERMSIALSLPTLGEPLRADAEVRWIGVADELGLQFATGFRAKETWALGQWLDRMRKGQKLA